MTWEEELKKSSRKYHIITCWLAGIIDPVWIVSDYIVTPDLWQGFAVIRICVAAISITVLLFRNKISVEMLIFIPFICLAFQNAYMYSVMDVEAFQQFTFAYITLFIGAGMLVLWKYTYTIIVVGCTTILQIVLFNLLSPLTSDEFLANGGLLSMTVALFSIILIQTRYRLTKNEIISRLALAESNEKLELQNEIIEEKNKDITDSINYARNIQDAILPNEGEIDSGIKDHFVLYRPKDIVSGDFYWFTNKKRYTFITAADCTGHGVPGAFVSMIGANLLDRLIIENDKNDTGDILSSLSDAVKRVFSSEGKQEAQDGMDMSLCAFEKDEDGNLIRMQFSGAQNPLFFIRKGLADSQLVQDGKVAHYDENLGDIRGDRTPIGGDTDYQYQFASTTLDLEKGDLIYIFSDGYQDQFGGPKGKKFMVKQLKRLLLDIQEDSMSTQKEKLEVAMDDWIGSEEQVDDILLIGIRV